MAVRVLLADEQHMLRQGLRAVLEGAGMEIVGEAADGVEAVRLAESGRPDVAVVDLVMPQLDGLDAAREILRLSPATGVVVLTMLDQDYHVAQAIHAGITGYVLKTTVAEDLLSAIRHVASGGIFFSSGVSREVVQASLNRGAVPFDPLTARERQVLQLVAEGRTTKQTAASLGISAKTVATHRLRIMRKLELQGTAALVRYAIRRGVIRA